MSLWPKFDPEAWEKAEKLNEQVEELRKTIEEMCEDPNSVCVFCGGQIYDMGTPGIKKHFFPDGYKLKDTTKFLPV